MQGKIINFNPEKSFGFIMDENGHNYFFHTTDVNKPLEVSKNKMVTFKASKNQKGLCAKNVVLAKAQQNNTQQNKNTHKSAPKKTCTPSKQKKSKFFRIKDLTVNLNDVKGVKVQENGTNSNGYKQYKLVINTYNSGIIVNYYNYYTYYNMFDEYTRDDNNNNDNLYSNSGINNYEEVQKDLELLLSSLS